MTLTRTARLLAALVTLFSLLFTQLAVAAYVCPRTSDAPMVMDVGADMANCHGMKVAQPGLCHAHCDAGNQSADTAAAPHVQPFVAGALCVVLQAEEIVAPRTDAIDATLLMRSTAPPLSIQHCCFRI